jgi:hypothetical protein
MADISEANLDDAAESDAERGAEAARLIWEDRLEAEASDDPRTARFSRAVIDGLAASLRASPGVLKKMMKNAQHAAADLNVGPFQELVEVIQNSDDLGATEVRVALRQDDWMLFVVHNGLPVKCHRSAWPCRI